LGFCAAVKPKLDFIASHPALKQYAKPLEKLMFVRLLQQLSRVFDIIKISEFAKLVYFAKFYEVESVIVESSKKGIVEVRIDHQNGILNFKSQSLESPQLRSQLVSFATNLQSAIRMIHPDKFVDNSYQQKKKEEFTSILKNLHDEHQRIQARKVEIERRKELHEQQLKLQALKEEEERRKRQLELEEIERERQRLSALERERIKKQKEDEEKKEKERQLLATMISQKSAGLDPALVSKLEIIDPEDFVRKRIEQHEKEEIERARRLTKLDKHLNWIERVLRLEEAPLIAHAYQKQSEDDKKNMMKNIKIKWRRNTN